MAAQIGKISAILEGKVPADQAEGFKSWLVAIAGKVANAATEGGFFGFGGEKVTWRKPQQSTDWLSHSV